MASIASASSSKADEPPHEPSTRVSSRTGTIAPSVRSQADLFYGLERRSLKPCSPLWVQYWSYKREHIQYNTAQPPIARLRPMELEYRRETDVMSGWQTCSHPEGRLYFYRPRDPDEENSRPVLTNSMLFDNENYLRAEIAQGRVNELLQAYPETPEDTLIVVDIRSDYDWYYCASWSMRRIFWPEETDVTLSSGGGVDVYDVSHLENRNQALFWSHAITFPKFGGAYAPISEIRNLLNFAYVDTMTSETSPITIDKDTLVQFRGVIDQLKEADTSEHTVWIVARMMEMFCKSRFLNYFGQPEAVLNWGDKVQVQSRTRLHTTLFRTVSPFLFGWPSVYLKDIEEIWVNGNIRFTRGQQFITDMKQDWEESTTPATMLLTANVSLLAIQSIDNVKGEPSRSLAQIAAYVSLLLSLANYITCQILLRQHRRIINSNADLYFLGPSKEINSLETMAIVFSLPQGFFLWSMLTFLLAICWIFFWHTSSVTRILLGVILGVLFVILSGLSFSPWQPAPNKHLTLIERQEKLAAKIKHWFGRWIAPQRRVDRNFTLDTMSRRS